MARLSLDFDVAHQATNHFGLSRDPATLHMAILYGPAWHQRAEEYLIRVGNRLHNDIPDLTQFSFLCAMLILNPDSPGLQNPQLVQQVRLQYDKALASYFSNRPKMDERMAKFYAFLVELRQALLFFHDILEKVTHEEPQLVKLNTPLFRQVIEHVVQLPKVQ